MREKACAIMGMNILVAGYGRIGRVLSQYLCALGANVTVCARKLSDLAWARVAGCSAVHIDAIDDVLGEFDTIVNTVPAQIFDKARLLKLKRGRGASAEQSGNECLIVDLASMSGVGNTVNEVVRLAKETGVKVIWALSLPGKIAPITAGEIIADTILNLDAEANQSDIIRKDGDNNE